MKVFPVLLALALGVVVYFAVIDRNTARAFLQDAGVIGAQGVEPETAAEATPEAEPAAEVRDEAAPFRVVALRSEAQQIDSAVILRGQTEAVRQVEVRAETTARIVSEPLRRGAFVDEGQLLCALDPGTRFASLGEARARVLEAQARKAEAEARVPEAQARLTEARAGLEEARVNQNAARRLSEDGFASETRVKAADAAFASAEAAVEAALSGLQAARSGIQSATAGIESANAAVAGAEREVERLEITAPFPGVLETDTAELGSLLQAGGLCATVIQLDPIKLVAFVPETEVNRVTVGALAGARLAAGGADITGTVTFLSRAADPQTRTFRVEIEVPNTDLRLRDGQTAEILIQSDGANAHLLPASALTLNEDGRLGIRAVGAGSAVIFVPVTLLRDTVDGVWLTGLPDAVDVIIVGQEYVTEGVVVEAVFQEEQTQ
ncbi:MAG: efflux RND transporter periplasmic adaptor subunit [Pseudomonadota bacterium]